jgi:hypothetical protein
MGLIQKQVTSAVAAANQANSQKSTGPQSELGKRHSSQNACTHLVYARVTAASMKVLGEDPAEFAELRDSLRRVFAPCDEFEEMLVEDMAELRWRRQRLLRAEAGMIAWKKRKFVLDYEWRLAKGAHKARANELEATQTGFVPLIGGPSEYLKSFGMLRRLREEIQTEGFVERGLRALLFVYGDTLALTATGYPLRKAFEELHKEQKAGNIAAYEGERKQFLSELEHEIEHFSRLYLLDNERSGGELTEPMRDAQLVPRQKDLEKIVRYEASLERLFERKLQQLVAWRREKAKGGEKEAPGSGPSGHHEVM